MIITLTAHEHFVTLRPMLGGHVNMTAMPQCCTVVGVPGSGRASLGGTAGRGSYLLPPPTLWAHRDDQREEGEVHT